MQIHTIEAPKIWNATPLVVFLWLYGIHIDWPFEEEKVNIPSFYFWEISISILMQIKMAKHFSFTRFSLEKWTQNHYIFWQREQSAEKVEKKVTGTLHAYPLSILFFFRIFANLFSPRRLVVISSFIVAESILICASAYVREALKRLKRADITIHNWTL